MCSETVYSQSYATFFRHSAILSVPAVLLRKLPNILSAPTIKKSVPESYDGSVNIVYGIESAAYGVICTSCLCQKPERARYERVRAFDTNNECI